MNDIDLCRLEDVKAWLNLDAESDGDDLLLSRLITAASDRIQKFLNLSTIKAKDVEIVFSGTGMHSIVFAESLNAVHELWVDGQEMRPAPSPVGAGGYVFSGTRISMPGRRFPKGLDNCRIRCNVGFEVVPFDIEQACIELTAFRYRERDRIGHSSKTIAGETVAYVITEMPASVRDALRPYVRVTTPSWGL